MPDAVAGPGQVVIAVEAIGVGGVDAERAVAGLDDITPLPADLSAVDAVTVGSSAPVARFALAHAHVSTGESVLVRGAAGSIGIAAVELAAAAGANTVAVTTSSAERGRRLRKRGATMVLDRNGEAPADAETATAASDFDVIIDVVGGPELPGFLDRLAPNGRLVSVGVVAGMPPADFGMRLLQSFQKSRSFATFSLAAADAHRAMDRGEVFGRIVLTTEP